MNNFSVIDSLVINLCKSKNKINHYNFVKIAISVGMRNGKPEEFWRTSNVLFLYK